MDLDTANGLKEGVSVRHSNRGHGVWYGVDEWDKTTCWVEFPGEGQPLRVTLEKVEAR